jgi:hypothetical protein
VGLQDKVANFVKQHGYSTKAFLLSALVFPPAALFIAWKHPSWSGVQRGVALAGLAIFLAVIPFVGAAVFTFVFGTIKELLS